MLLPWLPRAELASWSWLFIIFMIVCFLCQFYEAFVTVMVCTDVDSVSFVLKLTSKGTF